MAFKKFWNAETLQIFENWFLFKKEFNCVFSLNEGQYRVKSKN